jgi:tripartite-type tricarboxylate transporter receptor subunit TctC
MIPREDAAPVERVVDDPAARSTSCAAPRRSVSPRRRGHRVIVDSRPGAGTNIGTEIVVRAQPDGYTLLCNTGTIAINPTKRWASAIRAAKISPDP